MKGKINNKGTISQPSLFEIENTRSGSKTQSRCSVMYCDGASSGNPGKSGIGVVISLADKDTQYADGREKYTISEYIGIATNNIAEYTALLKGLEKAASLGIRKIKIFLDSELLVRQINGIYKVKNKKLMSLWLQVNNILKEFDYYKISHVRRELNSEADSLARNGIRKM